VPLQIGSACREVMALAQEAAAKGNPNVISDAGVAMLMAESGLRSAVLNVLINLKWIKDDTFVAKHRAQVEQLLEGAPEMREDLYTTILGELQ
jgi:methenyltetrahydrofolate cyclohydrolase